MPTHSSNTSIRERIEDGILYVQNWFARTSNKLRNRKNRTTETVEESNSALKSTSLEEHVGLAGMAMPTLPQANKRSFYGRIALFSGIVIFAFFFSFLGLSQLQNARDQSALRADFRYTLANATAPVSGLAANNKLMAEGTPVAIIQIPKLGTDAVVVEGTTSDITTHGPGHRRDTVLPGQTGVSVIYGRQVAYGAVFNQIGALAAGDEIDTITGQGKSTYTVMDVRYTGEKLPTPPADGEGRLTLVSATGIPLFPSSAVRVDAKLTSKAQLTPLSNFTYAALGDDEEALRGNADAWPLLTLTLVLLVALILGFTLLRRLWGKWQTWIIAIPVLVAVGGYAGLQVATLFPNLV